ncbi:hypothetical protein, partial [Leptospira interrogans]|uniref:hypothetical protein n=1 Tax=Leptospira interrogans TaxID=173 RepID=UPI0040355364
SITNSLLVLKCAELERCEKTTLKVWLVIAICRIIYAKALLYEHCTVATLKKWVWLFTYDLGYYGSCCIK